MWRWTAPTSALLLSSAGFLALPSCRQDMHDQPRYKPLAVSHFFADGTSARQPVPGTVPRGATQHSLVFLTGRQPQEATSVPPVEMTIPPPETPDKEQLAAWRAIHAAEAAGGLAERQESLYVDTLPIPLTLELLERGQQRFDIFCAVCHDRTGTGEGMIVRKGFSRPPSFHSDRLRAVKLGHLFDVISNGFGAMPSYAAQVPPADRWAIIAYIRALQLSQWARPQDLKSGGRP